MKNLILTTIIFLIAVAASLYVGYHKGKEDQAAECIAILTKIEAALNTESILLDQIFDQVASLGCIHAVNVQVLSP